MGQINTDKTGNISDVLSVGELDSTNDQWNLAHAEGLQQRHPPCIKSNVDLGKWDPVSGQKLLGSEAT